jgi:hypothetical protein
LADGLTNLCRKLSRLRSGGADDVLKQDGYLPVMLRHNPGNVNLAGGVAFRTMD